MDMFTEISENKEDFKKNFMKPLAKISNLESTKMPKIATNWPISAVTILPKPLTNGLPSKNTFPE